MLLTTTTTPEVRDTVVELFDVSSYVTVARIPDRPNIYLHFESTGTSSHLSKLKWLINLLVEKAEDCPKTILYCSIYRKPTPLKFGTLDYNTSLHLLGAHLHLLGAHLHFLGAHLHLL